MAAACVLAFALTAAAIAGGAAGVLSLNDARIRLADHLDPALRAAQELASAYIDEETGVRGYVLAGQPAFLLPYEAGLRAAPIAVDDLRSALGDQYPVALANLDLIIRLGREWQTGYADPAIAAVRTGQPQPPLLTGKALFDRLREALRGQTEHLENLRADARAVLDQSARTLERISIVVGLVLVACVILLTIGLRRGVIRPVSGLAGQVRAVAAGDFRQRVAVAGTAEFVALSEDIDSMRLRILAELTAIQEAHERLESQARELERSNAELEQFAYVASHDLQEPLRKVASFCQMIEERYADALDERGRQYIEFAVDGAVRMQRLINDLLAFSRVGRQSTGSQEVEGDELVRQAVAGLSVIIDETGATVTADPLPVLYGDATLLTNALQNLFGNAIKFRRPDTAPAVRLSVEERDEDWLFTCTDNGIGIEPQYADRIFTIFQRLHPRSAYPGTGIGLAMCRKIIEYHGGRIWLDTEPITPEGATFRFTLPALPEDE